jgi:Primosomal protein N'' (replication factor Y) - superfamily II helicase
MDRTEKECLHEAEMRTFFNNKNVDHLLKKIDLYKNDPDQEKRATQQICKHCFYINNGRIAGQAFTTSCCDFCDGKMTFPTTDTDKFCPECAEQLSVCKHCGAKMD